MVRVLLCSVLSLAICVCGLSARQKVEKKETVSKMVEGEVVKIDQGGFSHGDDVESQRKARGSKRPSRSRRMLDSSVPTKKQ